MLLIFHLQNKHFNIFGIFFSLIQAGSVLKLKQFKTM